MFNALFTKTDEYAKLAQALGGPGACALFGIPGTGRAMVYAALAKALDKPLCIVTPGEAEATRFAGDLNALGVAAAVFPARDYVLRPIEGTGREYEYRRLAVLGDLVGGRLQAVCVPDEGLTQYTTPRADFCANTRSLRPGDAKRNHAKTRCGQAGEGKRQRHGIAQPNGYHELRHHVARRKRRRIRNRLDA